MDVSGVTDASWRGEAAQQVVDACGERGRQRRRGSAAVLACVAKTKSPLSFPSRRPPRLLLPTHGCVRASRAKLHTRGRRACVRPVQLFNPLRAGRAVVRAPTSCRARRSGGPRRSIRRARRGARFDGCLHSPHVTSHQNGLQPQAPVWTCGGGPTDKPSPVPAAGTAGTAMRKGCGGARRAASSA